MISYYNNDKSVNCNEVLKTEFTKGQLNIFYPAKKGKVHEESSKLTYCVT